MENNIDRRVMRTKTTAYSQPFHSDETKKHQRHNCKGIM